MPTYIGENKIVDRYLGDKFLEAAYIGDEKVYDPYTEITGYLPMIFKSRATVALKNYRIHGTTEGAGVETENLFDAEVEKGSFNPNTGVPEDVPYRVRTTFSSNPLPAGTYTISVLGASSVVVYAYTSESTEDYSRSASQTSWQSLPYTFTTSNPLFLRFAFSSGKTIVPSDVSNIMIIPGSIAPASYIPPGYKIPILNTSGVTENLYDGTDISGSLNNTYYINDFIYANLSQGTYTLAYDLETTATSIYASSVGVGTTGYSKDIQIQFTKTDGHFVFTFTIKPDDAGKNLYARFARFSTLTTITYTASNIMLVEGSTPPDHYIPHRYTSNYDLFIGDSKLYEDEYVDFAEQKIYKDVGGTITPTDPPVPLPAINAYKGENTLSSTESVGNMSVRGRISAISP